MTTLETLLGEPETVGTWKLVSDRSSFRFTNRTLWGLANVKGRFDEASGAVQITDENTVSGHVIIAAASLNTGMGSRDDALRSADFFDVERFPEITVVVTAVNPTGGSAADLEANASIKGTTQPLPLPVTVAPLDDGSVRISTKLEIDRARFELGENKLGLAGNTTTVTAEAVFAHAQQ
jgi:polyisoprenoid-binding protein YceI